MTVGRLVVDRRTTLQDCLQFRRVEHLPCAVRQTSSARQSGAAIAIGHPPARARPSSSGSLRCSMPRANSFSIASGPRRNTSTRARESSAALGSNDGFAVVAPTSTTGRCSITGRNESCCALLKRCTSSTNSSVPFPVSRRARAASNTFLRSATPENTAEICSKCSSVASARRRATVVLPVPGGPQNTGEPSVRVSSIRVSAPSGPRI